MISVPERLQALREKMKERNMDAYLIPTADYHESEYVGEYFACRKFITGFTGSAGTAVITQDFAGVWTDGRYFVQAAAELSGSGIELMKMGQEGIPSIDEFLKKKLPYQGVLGFDGRVVSAAAGERMKKQLDDKEISFVYAEDLAGEVWEERPPLSAKPVWLLDERYAGKAAADKLAALRAVMKKEKATVHLLTTLDDIVWLLNIRGNDVPCNPVVLSYLAIRETEIRLFIQAEVLSEEVTQYLSGLGVTICPYQSIYDYAAGLHSECVLLEKERVNYALIQALDSSNKIRDVMNPTVIAKAVKNDVEIKNMKQAHIKDGVAVTKFIYWLKMNIGSITMTEVSAADYLEELRTEQGCLEPSFSTISAYGPNAAMCHYHAERNDCAELKASGLYLVDSGGQYYEGTTDITRTVALGQLTQEEREHFTLVAMSMLRLGHVRFLKGCSGLSLDYVAREPMWSRGLDYNHGTGHGIGYLLNVHERPNGIRYRVVPERLDSWPIEPGMICSDEPGIYIEGSHGIRTENLILCVEDGKTEYGQFLKFEYLTYVPIDLDALDVAVMDERDINYLNEYHCEVYEKISPYLTKEEREWLRVYTRPVSR